MRARCIHIHDCVFLFVSLLICITQFVVVIARLCFHHLYYNVILKYVCLSMLANSRSQVLLDRLGRCIKLFVSTKNTSCHEFAYQFGLEIFYTRKTTKTIANTESPARLFICKKQRPVFNRQRKRRKCGVNFASMCVCARMCVYMLACVRACVGA